MQQKRSSQDTSIIGTIIAAVCIVIYLVALVQAAVRLYLSVDQRKMTSDYEFDTIANVALSAGHISFMDEAFISSMNRALSSCRTIEAVIISGPDAEYAFERKRGHAITWINNSPRIIKKFGFTDDGLYRNLPIPNLRNVNIHAVAGIFDYTAISRILKETLLIILIGFTLAFFTMLLQLLLAKPQESIPDNKEAVKDDVEIEFDNLETPGLAEKTAPPVTEKEPEKEPDKDESLKESDDGKEPAAPAVETGPKGLYSPRSNIGWEEYTDDRLESELHRCASTENDLTLLFIEFIEELDDAQYKQAAEEVVSFFVSRDLLFERGDQGITAILPGVDLEAGLDKANKFIQRMKEKLFSNSADDCVYIGLSSRAGRLLNAERLLLETGEALKRAGKDPDTAIIAFKSDLEKYRKFIASQSPTRS